VLIPASIRDPVRHRLGGPRGRTNRPARVARGKKKAGRTEGWRGPARLPLTGGGECDSVGATIARRCCSIATGAEVAERLAQAAVIVLLCPVHNAVAMAL
jgi:hypothetical protein